MERKKPKKDIKKTLKEELVSLLENNDDEQAKMCLAMIKKAQDGDVRAFLVIRETLGEKPESTNDDTMRKLDAILEKMEG